MIEAHRTQDRIAELLVHIGRAARCETAGSGLTAAQWTCLRFFAWANGSTRTPSAFAEFQATTRGTASQTVKSLERRGLVARARSRIDGRSVRFDLTDTGRAMMARDPLRDLVDAVEGIDSRDRDGLLRILSRLASDIAARRGAPAFGTCRDCSHFEQTGGMAYCACMAAELAATDIDRLCASYHGPSGKTQNKGARNGAT